MIGTPVTACGFGAMTGTTAGLRIGAQLNCLEFLGMDEASLRTMRVRCLADCAKPRIV